MVARDTWSMHARVLDTDAPATKVKCVVLGAVTKSTVLVMGLWTTAITDVDTHQHLGVMVTPVEGNRGQDQGHRRRLWGVVLNIKHCPPRLKARLGDCREQGLVLGWSRPDLRQSVDPVSREGLR